jgi:hypothetical protein
MSQLYGANFEQHPMVAPLWQKLEGIQQHLEQLDTAVNAILKHLNISVPGVPASNGDFSTAVTNYADPSDIEISSEPYKYKPLSLEQAEIRVLVLKNARNDEDEIQGSLVNLSLEGRRSVGSNPYNALSYTWGEPKMDQRIIIDGHPLFITQNLESSLRHLRRKARTAAASTGVAAKPIPWWIDQICRLFVLKELFPTGLTSLTGINQADIEERGNQVSLMRRIYKNALYVQVWLGDTMPGSALAMELAMKIGRPPARGPGEKEVVYSSYSEEEVAQHWKSLRLLFSQPWWDRSWIRQELALGSRANVAWGEHTVPFEAISQAAMAIEYADSLGHQISGLDDDQESQETKSDGIIATNFYHQAKGLRTLRKNTHSGHTFLPLPELLMHSRFCMATDQRDKVYSMLGLADPEVYRLRADYHLDLPEVLKSAARAVLPQKKGLRLLGACQNTERRHGLPSWVPNLVDGWKYYPFEPEDSRHFISTTESSVEFDQDTMLVKGFMFDFVTEMCDILVPMNATTEQLDAVFEAWQEFALEGVKQENLKGKMPGGRPSLQVEKEKFWLSFLSTDRMAGRFLRYSADDRTKLLPEEDSGLKLEYMGLNLKLAQSYLMPESADTTLHPLRRIRAALKKFGSGRRLGLCAKTQVLILLPGDAQVGDEVTVFRGASFPYILRKAHGPGGHDRVLVGESFMPEEGSNAAISMAHAMTTMDAIRVI